MFSSCLFLAVKSSSKNLGKNKRNARYALLQNTFSLSISPYFVKKAD